MIMSETEEESGEGLMAAKLPKMWTPAGGISQNKALFGFSLLSRCLLFPSTDKEVKSVNSGHDHTDI